MWVCVVIEYGSVCDQSRVVEFAQVRAFVRLDKSLKWDTHKLREAQDVLGYITYIE